jgi:regulator of protease activity HflC (stomatin/prohibitin superfamily)
VKKAEGEAKSKTIQARADAEVLKTVGDATAVKVLAIGNAEAAVTKAKIESMEANNYAAIQVAQALSQSGFRLVPDIMVAGGAGSSGGGTLVDVLLGNLIKEQMPPPAKRTTVIIPPGATDPSAGEPK